MAENEIETFSTPVRVTIVSFRYKLADTDGISGKAAIDGLVEAKILHDDSPEFVEEIRFRQKKISKDQQERTEIVVEEV